MRSINYILLLAGLFWLMPSCKKQSLLTYDTADNIYFNYLIQAGSIRTDSVNISFAYSPLSVQDSNVMIPIQISGAPSGTDREFAIQADPSSTAKAGTHYTLPDKLIVHAGSVSDSFPINFLRTPDMQDSTLQLTLHLVPSHDFHTDIKFLTATPGYQSTDSVSALDLRVYVSDILQEGPYWDNVFAAYYGTFSVKKVRLINQISGMPLNWPLVGIYDLNFGAKSALYAIETSRYLNDQAAAGNTIYEDDGVTPMTMGAQYQ